MQCPPPPPPTTSPPPPSFQCNIPWGMGGGENKELRVPESWENLSRIVDYNPRQNMLKHPLFLPNVASINCGCYVQYFHSFSQHCKGRGGWLYSLISAQVFQQFWCGLYVATVSTDCYQYLRMPGTITVQIPVHQYPTVHVGICTYFHESGLHHLVILHPSRWAQFLLYCLW